MSIDKKKCRASVLADASGGGVGASSNWYNIHRSLYSVKSETADKVTADFVGALYSNPHLTGGFACNFVHSASFDSLLSYSSDSFFLRPFENISIDKVSLLFNAPGFSEHSDVAKSFWRLFRYVIEQGTTKTLSETPLYRLGCEYANSYIIHWGVKQNNIETIRIEFNPNHSFFSDLIPLLGCFSEFKLELCRCSRMDIAIDYFMHINPLCWYVKNTPYSASYEYNSVLETRYFGSPSSAVQLRIYNKIRELSAHGDDSFVLPDCNLYRCEAQVKEVFGDSWFLADIDKVVKFNPFSRLDFYDPFCINTEGQGAYGLFVELAKRENVGYSLSILSDRRTKKQYLERLKSEMSKPIFNMPSVIYENCFREVYTRFVNSIRDLFDKAQQLKLGVSNVIISHS